MDDLNPYAAPQSEVLVQNSDAERVRRRYSRSESRVRGVGILYYLFAAVFLTMLLLMNDSEPQQSSRYQGWLFLGGLSAVFGVIGFGLRKLNHIAGILAALLSLVLLIESLWHLPGAILNTVIHGTVLAILMGQGGRRVLSPDYQSIIAATPGMSRTTSPWVWVVLGTLLVIVLVIALSIYLGKLLS